MQKKQEMASQSQKVSYQLESILQDDDKRSELFSKENARLSEIDNLKEFLDVVSKELKSQN